MESIKHIQFDAEKNYFRSDANEGNFIGLVKLVAGKCEELAAHIRICEEYANTGRKNRITFLSKTFVNNALGVIRKCLVKNISDEINRNTGIFGVLMDGSQDVSCKQQVSIVLRYTNDSNYIVERTICFVDASENTSGKGLYGLLKKSSC